MLNKAKIYVFFVSGCIGIYICATIQPFLVSLTKPFSLVTTATATNKLTDVYSGTLKLDLQLENKQIDHLYLHSNEVLYNSNQHWQRLKSDDSSLPKTPQETVQKPAALKSNKFYSFSGLPRCLIYSAHYDSYHSVIKFVGFGPMTDNHLSTLENLQCSVDDGFNQSELVPLSVYYRISTFVPWQGQTYDSYIYYCTTRISQPTSVSLHYSEKPPEFSG
ncbi:hypothetical protein EB796_003326 [Bugula neritina]|uniref:Uncharacterized protein n=1 Tax=Bugula neritina TaxID=10212 RepID=A0A7J7KIF8_BUGNE|nr:hypothetical protein EB796_003326 [Bugula neritina]